MIDCVYYAPHIRCYRDGKVERLNNKRGWEIVGTKINSNGYYSISIGNRNEARNIKIHRLIAFCFMGLKVLNGSSRKEIIDHKNHIRIDNRTDNLSIGTDQQNVWNTIAKGYRKSYKKWRAYINVNKKRIDLGSYDTEDAARNAYLQSKEKYHII
jgi:hypothetical protein